MHYFIMMKSINSFYWVFMFIDFSNSNSRDKIDKLLLGNVVVILVEIVMFTISTMSIEHFEAMDMLLNFVILVGFLYFFQT